MQILKMFTVYDSASESYMAPFTFKTVGLAMRWFKDSANDPESRIAQHPADYTLMEIGTFCDDDAQMVPHEAKHPLANAIEMVDGYEPPEANTIGAT